MKTILSIIAATFILSACNNSDAQDIGNDTGSKTGGNNIISFKADGNEIKTSAFNLTLFKLKKTGQLQLGISSNMHEDARTLNANIGGIAAGTYLFKQDNAFTYGNYYPDFKKDPRNSYSFVSGSFVITELDTVKHIVNAQFSGTVKNSNGQEIKISEGKIENGKLNSKIESY